MPPYDPFNTRLPGKDQERLPAYTVTDPITANPVQTQSIPVPLDISRLGFAPQEQAPFSRSAFEALFAPQQESPLLQALMQMIGGGQQQPAGGLAAMMPMQRPASQPRMASAPRQQQQQAQPRQQSSPYGVSGGTRAGPVWSGTSPTASGGPSHDYRISPDGKTVSWTSSTGKTLTAPRNV